MLHRLFSSCGAQGLLIVVAFLVVERRLQCMWASVVVARGLHSHAPLEHRLDSFGLWAELLLGMCDISGSDIKSVSPELEGLFFTTEPPGKPLKFIYLCFNSDCNIVIEVSPLLSFMLFKYAIKQHFVSINISQLCKGN